MSQLKSKFLELLKSKDFLILLHRGAHGGNIVENTANAVNIALREGADIVEIDISMSTDGDFFVFHDGGEKRLLDDSRNINTLSTTEIEEKYYYNELGHVLHKKVERFSKLLENIQQDVFLNIDRSWDYWETFIPYLDQFVDCHPYFMLKSPVKKEFLDILDKHPIKYMYFPIIYNTDELDLLETYENINFVGFEVIEKDESFEFINSQRFDKYKQSDYMFLANAINLDDDTLLFGSLTDEVAITRDPDEAWGAMLKMGINAIQTDWVDLLLRYRDARDKK
ncbi:glycerophosphodiester phosphodiesterase family protein [Paenibacillus lentus]|uniref:glycerophosphodiester phosphodiesterase family protein n=1 Tax=Paenibacillus lentus TaxID=1338368 RepID=UPI00365453EC